MYLRLNVFDIHILLALLISIFFRCEFRLGDDRAILPMAADLVSHDSRRIHDARPAQARLCGTR